MFLAFLTVLQLSLADNARLDVWKQEIAHEWEKLDHSSIFKHWQNAFNRTYTDIKEEGHRLSIFMSNWEMINEHNLAGNRSFTLRLNQFGDMTGDEFQLYVHGDLQSCLTPENETSNASQAEYAPVRLGGMTSIPDSIDWTNYNGKNYVTPVKNQGGCGSCWAFSSTGAIESRVAIMSGKTGDDIIPLSQQQLLDCSASSGNSGCNGGLMTDAFKYVKKSGGLCAAEKYPYKGKQGSCKADTCGTLYDELVAYFSVKKESSDSLKTALSIGPVSVAVEADQSAFQFYSGGIMDGKCGTKLDHGVLVVGYGSAAGMGYWKIKNSWGTSWGEDGYILICRDCDRNGNKGECGILKTPSYPQPAS